MQIDLQCILDMYFYQCVCYGNAADAILHQWSYSQTRCYKSGRAVKAHRRKVG